MIGNDNRELFEWESVKNFPSVCLSYNISLQYLAVYVIMIAKYFKRIRKWRQKTRLH